jgi:hypothetical protein
MVLYVSIYSPLGFLVWVMWNCKKLAAKCQGYPCLCFVPALCLNRLIMIQEIAIWPLRWTLVACYNYSKLNRQVFASCVCTNSLLSADFSSAALSALQRVFFVVPRKCTSVFAVARICCWKFQELCNFQWVCETNGAVAQWLRHYATHR